VAGTLTILEEAGAKGLLDYSQPRDRLVSGTTFYVTEEVLRESEQRYHDLKHSSGQEQNAQERASTQGPAEEPA
jgi:hypothetical protein